MDYGYRVKLAAHACATMDLEIAGEIIPADRIFVSESGIKTPEDAAAVKRAGADAVLIGETLMRSENKKEALKLLKSAL